MMSLMGQSIDRIGVGRMRQQFGGGRIVRSTLLPWHAVAM
jgi:hypothetical protein